MPFKRMMKSNKYLVRISLWVTSVIVLSILILSSIVYYNVQQKVLHNEYKNSQKLINQTKFNMEYLDEMSRNLTMSIYYNNDVRALMYLNDDETYDYMNAVNELNSSVIRNNPFVHSVYIYNNNKNRYYSTYGEFFHHDAEWDKLLAAQKKLPVLKPIIRVMSLDPTDHKKGTQLVISYVMYDMLDDQGNMDGAVVINLKLDWLMNNIQAINTEDSNPNDQLYILDDKNHFIQAGSTASEEGLNLQNQIKSTYAALKPASVSMPKNSNFFTIKQQGTKYLVTYIPVEKTGWVLFKTVPYDEAYGYVHNLGTSIIVITIVVLLAALVVSLSISRGLYKPIKNLVAQTRSHNNSGTSDVSDEFAFLHGVYQDAAAQLNKFKSETNSNMQIMKAYFLRKLLLDSDSVSSGEFKQAIEEYALAFTFEQSFAVAVLKIDDYKSFIENRSMEEREVLRFAVCNITTELIGQRYNVESVDMKRDHVVMIVSGDFTTDAAMDGLQYVINEAQVFVKSSYKLSITAAISGHATDYSKVAKAYMQAIDLSSYRYTHGQMSILTSDVIVSGVNLIPIEDVMQAGNQFIETMKRGDLAGTEEKLAVLFQLARKLEHSDMMLALMYTVNRVKNTIFEINHSRLKPVNVNAMLLNRELFELETMDELYLKFIEVIHEAIEGINDGRDKQESMTAETIKDIIEANYANVGFGGAEIAAMLRISQVKAGKLFKEQMGMSILEFINHVRLSKSVEWLENSRLSISEIIRKVGIENESYFYKIFKLKYGSTPREYIAKRAQKQF
ncbi:AraC family transcriptional regulator [Paenibacillus lignilyticus]|uniref:AraC family transcriptional regulator n=1 Tax=Paenibacillus lignilyticus TaxID=1172615 RepID=A0ABS5CJ43_9BACL|nr:AraC family transcriptional regulator [Paenibacillus lignilyticus]MBP3965842.1 AraC family transcriptional regulator [Paenibacillus lignilyticus]